jgi:hypothetical protein
VDDGDRLATFKDLLELQWKWEEKRRIERERRQNEVKVKMRVSPPKGSVKQTEPVIDESRPMPDPDHAYGLPVPDDADDWPLQVHGRHRKRKKIDTTMPGFSLDPDEGQRLVETSQGRLLLGPAEDVDEVEESLANSYGG